MFNTEYVRWRIGEKTMTNGKVLDKQTLEFGARILQNLPAFSNEEMQELIKQPKEIARRLTRKHKPCWVEKDGVIYLPPIYPCGTTGVGWITRTKERGGAVGHYAEQVLHSSNFTTSPIGEPIRIAVMKGELFSDVERCIVNIRTEGAKRGWGNPYPDIGCYICELLTDDDLEAMGLWGIITMHEQIDDSCETSLLGAGQVDDGRRLFSYYGCPGYKWLREFGFAFDASQASSES